VFFLVLDQVRQAGEGTVLVEDFADHAAWVETGQLGQIDRCFGMAGTLQNATGACAEGEDMSRLDELLGVGIRVTE
tara:strand:- start:1241 stop:1468 length:228 start_codon:yes stop_codon:yes gene_type:complete